MIAAVGDRIVVRGPRVDAPVRDGEVVGVPHEDGSPPYAVRWSDTGHVGLFFPGPDAVVHHGGHRDGGRHGAGSRARGASRRPG